MNIYLIKDCKNVVSPHKCKATNYKLHPIMCLLNPSLGCYKHEKNQWRRKNIKVKIDTRHMELTIRLLNDGVVRTDVIVTPIAKS
jgi:hypothetical protein